MGEYLGNAYSNNNPIEENGSCIINFCFADTGGCYVNACKLNDLRS